MRNKHKTRENMMKAHYLGKEKRNYKEKDR